jgi:clan AA aspartic protease (TIGR02281 family)
MPRITATTLLALLLMTGQHAAAQTPSAEETTCSGEFLKLESGYYIVGYCGLSAVNAENVMKVCSLGQQCVITGTVESCKGIRGACAEMTHITAAHWGKPLPPCAATAATDRADRWWSDNSSLVLRGTIFRSTKSGGDDTPPYGHTKIVMDLTTCSTGSPMAVDRVSDGWIGHYVELNGTAMKGPNGWYIVARSIKDVAFQSPQVARRANNSAPPSLSTSSARFPNASSRTTISLKKVGGTFVVPVGINDAITLDFTVDSGAADVSVPLDVFSTLARTGTIRDTDITGEQTYVLADGSKSQSVTFTIRSLKVGDIVIENVKGGVSPLQGSLLLGQSFLERFKSWSIDNTKHELLLEPR